MILLMRAGKPIVFEPAAAKDLATEGIWDETQLLRTIRSHGFAFMITRDDLDAHYFRTPEVDAAMREAYPRLEPAAPRLWLHLPGT
jgi:hypothetical protein